MKPARQIRLLLNAVGGAVLLLVGVYLFFSLGGQDLVKRPAPPTPSETAAMAAPPGGRPDSFADIADAVKPAVVNIATLQATRPGPRGADPVREVLRSEPATRGAATESRLWRHRGSGRVDPHQ